MERIVKRGRRGWMRERGPRSADEKGVLSGTANLPERLGTGGWLRLRVGTSLDGRTS